MNQFLGLAAAIQAKMPSVMLPYAEFREYLVENDDAGPWGDTYFHEVFDKYVEDDAIEIEYKYGAVKNGKTTILWRLAAEEGKGKVYKVRYGGSSHFAMWWCGWTDDLEDEEEEQFVQKCMSAISQLS